MHKILIIPIIVVIVLAAGIAGYFVSQKPALPEPQPTATPSGQQIDIVKCMQDCMKGGKQPSECESQCGVTSKPSPTNEAAKGKCGDGTCDEIEKTVCSQDCKAGIQPTAPPASPIDLYQTQSTSLLEVDLHQLVSNSNFGNILKLFNPVIDEENRKLYISGTKSTYIGVIDLTQDTLIETFDIGVPGGFLILSSGALYSYDIAAGKCYQIDRTQKKATEVQETTCENILPRDKGKIKTWGSYGFKDTGYQSFPDGTSGFPTDWRQDLNALYGVIDIYDSSNNKLGEIIHGPDALIFAIDQSTGKLYTSNTGDGSISVFDLNKLKSTNYCQNNSCWVKDIDVGDSADEVIADSSGNLYVRNRLGGSVLYKYNTKSGSLTIINNENHLSNGKAMFNNNHAYDGISMWPTDMELSKDEKRLYLLSHFGALIDVLDTATNKVSSRIQWTTSLKPRTDSISAMTVDKSRDRIFAAFPELGIICAADGLNNKVLGTIDLTKYGFDKSKAANAGPGLINLAVNEKTNKLYVHLYNEKKLLVFNGDTLAKENEASWTLAQKRELSLTSNNEKGVIYLGNKIYDASTLQETGSFSSGGTVIAFNNKNNSVYLTKMGSGSKPFINSQEKIYEFSGNLQTKEWTLDEIGSIPSRFYFDFGKNIFYVAYFESAIVKKYDMTSASAPSASSNNSGASTDIQGKCGDGVCGPVEKEKGVCPEDCK